MIRFVATVAVVVAGLAAVPCRADEPLDTRADQPYSWRIVVDCRPHPLLGTGFRDRLSRDIRAALQPAVGELARVDVVDLAATPADERESLWTAFADRGWPALDAAETRVLTGTKTHFLRVEVRGRTFRLESRQLDGDTGLLSPLLRTHETTAPESVGRLAGLMLGRDFGPVGTVIEIGKDSEWVRLRLRASGRGDFRPFVQRGDVFAVAVIRDPVPDSSNSDRPMIVSQPREYTLFRASGSPTPSGTLKCDVLTRFVTPLPEVPGVAGFRALKLATVEAPLTVKVVGTDGGPPPNGLPVRVRATDTNYNVRPHPRDFLTLRDGLFRTDRVFHNVACVTVSLGGGSTDQQYPLPILAAGEPHVLPYGVTAEAVAKAAFERRCEELRGRIADARTSQRALYEGVFLLTNAGKNQEAYDRVSAGLTRLRTAAEGLSTALARLKAEPDATKPRSAALLASSENLLSVVRDGLPPLDEHASLLKESLEKAKDPARYALEFRAKGMVAQIKQYLDYGEVPEALSTYDALITLTDQADVKAQRDRLAKAWEPKSPEHKAARDFVAGPWRTASTTAEYQAVLPRLKESAELLIAVDDRYGLRALLTSLEPPLARVKRTAESLDPDSDVDRPQLRDLQALVNGLLEVESAARTKLTALGPVGD